MDLDLDWYSVQSMLTSMQKRNTNTVQTIVSVLLFGLMQLSIALKRGHRIIANHVVRPVSKL